MIENLRGKLDYILGFCSIISFGLVCVMMLYFMHGQDRQMHSGELQGSGLEADPYIIADKKDYLFFARQFDDYGSEYASCYVRLADDIILDADTAGEVFGNEEKGLFFAGVFDGGGHTISGLRYEGEYGGLFPRLIGEVYNLNIKDARIKGRHAAGITGELGPRGCIVNCSSDGIFEGECAADVCSTCYGYIENCASNSTLPPVYRIAVESRVKNLYDTIIDSDHMAAQIAEILNENVECLVPGRPYFKWKSREDEVYMTDEISPVARAISARVDIGGRVQDVKGFFSLPERRWFMVLPESSRQESIKVTVYDADGSFFETEMDPDDASFVIDSTLYRVEFLFYDDVPSVFVDFYDDNELSYLFRSTDLYETGSLFMIDENGKKTASTSRVIFSGRGNDSYGALKKGYSIELPIEMSLAGMEKTYDYNLISGYRDNCFFNYIYTRDLYRGLGLDYAHEYRPVNLYINGKFQGLYFLTEKMTISKSAFDLENMAENTKRLNGLRLYEYPLIEEGGSDHKARRVYYDLSHEPEDVTGGYLMEITMLDFALTDSRFITDRGVIVSSKGDKYLGRRQLDYISSLFQDFEDAVTSPDGYNDKGVYYADYIDMESFADQWIMFETAADLADDNSVYFYKDSDSRGDGNIHAVWYWDVEHALMEVKRLNEHFLMRRAEKGMDCSYNKVNTGNFWTWIYAHEDFRAALSKEWREKFYPAFKGSLSRSLRDNSAGVGTFRWYETQYSTSFWINDRCWYDTDYRAKCRDMSKRLEKRITFLRQYFI